MTQTSLTNSFVKMLKSLLNPWHESLAKPAQFQEELLACLLKEHAKTDYGKKCNASETQDISQFRSNFPVINYRFLNPYLAEIQKGNYRSILTEPLTCWVMTRGSTGPAKVLPATKTHLEHIFSCGARALVNLVIRKQDWELLSGSILNLNFPSNIHETILNGQSMNYGYSSGTYARLNPALGQFKLIPRQEEIDALGAGITRSDWERRFELAYQKSLGVNVTSIIGVTPVILAYARYVKGKHGKNPRDLWRMHALFCTSVRKIPFKYGPLLRRYFGDVDIVEIYSATEGVFAQQLDDLPYVSPNYDTYFFEVATGKEVKMLHEMKRGEWGKLIISSSLFLRYDIGDLIECSGKNYFRVIGRNKFSTILEHRAYRLLFHSFY